jgi:hypothetical protein
LIAEISLNLVIVYCGILKYFTKLSTMNTLIVLSLLIIRMVASFINDLYGACHFKTDNRRSPFKEASVVL